MIYIEEKKTDQWSTRIKENRVEWYIETTQDQLAPQQRTLPKQARQEESIVESIGTRPKTLQDQKVEVKPLEYVSIHWEEPNTKSFAVQKGKSNPIFATIENSS